MMGIPPSEARELSWWEYQAMLTVWNERHGAERDEPAEAPDPEFVARRRAKLNESGIARSIH